MKLRTMLSILLIGMISLTAFASTSDPGQKSKAIATIDLVSFQAVVNVVPAVVNYNLQTTSERTMVADVQKNEVAEPTITIAALDDVGWRNCGTAANITTADNYKLRKRSVWRYC